MDLPIEGGSAKEMGPPSEKLYGHKLLVSLLFKVLILNSLGNSYTAEQWESSFLSDSAQTEAHD